MIAIILIGIVVTLVAIDALGRLDEPRRTPSPPPRLHDPTLVTTQKIVIDLKRRD